MKKFIEKNAVFLHKSLNGLADSLIKIFVPVLILKETQNIYLAILFMLIKPLTFILFNILLKNFLSKHPTASIVIHIIPVVILQILLFFVPINIFITIILGILSGLFTVFYSVPANLLFVFADNKLNVSKMEMGKNFGKIIFIIIAGFVINNSSVGYLIALVVSASVIYVLSVLPLIFGSHLIKAYHFQPKKKVDIFDKKEKIMFNIFHASFGSFQILIDDVLPVFLFYNGLNFTSIATLQAGIEVTKLISNIMAGYFYRKKLSKISVVVACVIYAVSVILFLIIKDKIVIYILSGLVGLTFPLIFIPNFKLFCERILKKTYLIDELSNRDTYVFSARPILIASYFIGFSFITPFIFAVLSSGILATVSFKLLSKNDLEKITPDMIE